MKMTATIDAMNSAAANYRNSAGNSVQRSRPL